MQVKQVVPNIHIPHEFRPGGSLGYHQPLCRSVTLACLDRSHQASHDPCEEHAKMIKVYTTC